MKKTFALILALLVMVMASAAAETRITVSGSGTTLVNADYAMVTLGVVHMEADVLKAQERSTAPSIPSVQRLLKTESRRKTSTPIRCASTPDMIIPVRLKKLWATAQALISLSAQTIWRMSEA